MLAGHILKGEKMVVLEVAKDIVGERGKRSEVIDVEGAVSVLGYVFFSCFRSISAYNGLDELSESIHVFEGMKV
jgi:L-amino acid N-acyltransferase YncA